MSFPLGSLKKKKRTCDYRHSNTLAFNKEVGTKRKIAWKMRLKVLWKCTWPQSKPQSNVGVKDLRSQKMLLKSCTTGLFSDNWATAAICADLRRVQRIAILESSQYWSSGDMSSDSQCRY